MNHVWRGCSRKNVPPRNEPIFTHVEMHGDTVEQTGAIGVWSASSYLSTSGTGLQAEALLPVCGSSDRSRRVEQREGVVAAGLLFAVGGRDCGDVRSHRVAVKHTVACCG